jgi:hypothetical protein
MTYLAMHLSSHSLILDLLLLLLRFLLGQPHFPSCNRLELVFNASFPSERATIGGMIRSLVWKLYGGELLEFCRSFDFAQNTVTCNSASAFLSYCLII